MSAVPVTKFNLNGSPVAAGSSENDFIGSVASLSLSFLNSSPTDPGYVPFIDLTLPANANGVSFANATYLGQPVIAHALTFDASGHATHPFLKDASGNPVIISGPPGGTLVVLTLPFGSFTPGQTPADIVVNLNVSSGALVNSPLDVTATPGFAFGNSPTGVTATNPPILGAQTDFNVVPQVVTLKTVYIGPEQETATGPSYPRAWDSVATIAPGQTLTQLVLTQKLPDGAVFLPGSSTLLYGTGAAVYGATDPNGTITYNAATNTVTGTFSVPVTGGVAGSTPTLRAGFYVTSNYTIPADGTTILDPGTGAFAPLADTSNLTANWASSNPLNPTVLTPAPATNVITAKSIAIQKGVTDLTHGQAAYQPNDTLQYSLDGQVSNYFDLNALVITDTLGDGQTFKAGFTPTISIIDLGQTLYSGTISASEYSVSAKAIDGTSVVTFNVSQILADHGEPTDLNGGTAANPAPATADITFDTTIDPTYSATPAPSVSNLVDQGDSIGNTVIFTGNVVSTGKTISDNSSASITLPTNTVTKTIYAVNGVKVTGPVTIQAGDLVTYDLTMTTPLTSTHLVSLTDFLPLPTFNATDPGANGGSGGFTFSNTTSATPPAVGVAEFGPADTFQPAVPGDVPTITTNAVSNSLTFNFGDYTEGTTKYPNNVADILYTVVAGDQPFADGLLLTNQVTESETNSFGVVAKQNAIVQVTLGEPELKIEKAVVATSSSSAVFNGNRGPDTYSAPGTTGNRFSGGVISGAALAANPLGDSLSGIVAGDTVTFAVMVENTGSGPNGAFDVILHDTIPAGFTAPTNIRVTDGAGNVLAYTNVGGGLFDPAGGIELSDNGAKGSLAAYNATNGKNVVVITYDATASPTVPVPNYDLHNVAMLTNYAAEQGGINDTAVTPAGNLVAASDVYTATPLFAKAVIATSTPAPTVAANNIHDLAIGAVATYDITLTLTKGTAGNVSIVDLLPSGAGGQLDLLSATVKSIGVDISGSALTVGASANGTNGAFNFGTLTDGSNTQGTADQIVVEVTARATNIAVNKGGESVVNTATVSETDPNNPSGTPYTQTTTAAELLVEPELKLTKTASSSTAQANDIVTYTLSFTNTNNANSAAAYNAAIADTLSQLGPNAVFQAGSVKILASSTAAATIVTGNQAGDSSVLVNVAEIDPGQVVNVTFTAKLSATALDHATINNTATVTADTLPNQNPAERVDSTSGSATVTVGPASIVKTLVSGSDANIAAPKLTAGETGTYKIVVTLPHGQTANLSVADVIPANLLYAGSATVTIGSDLTAAGGGPISFTITLNSNSPTFNFGTVQDTSTGASTASDQIVITYNALVAPTAANANGVKDTNTATLLTGGTTLGTSSATANIVAPLLTLVKTVSLNGALPEAGSDATYTLVITQTGTSPAYAINLADLLPADVTYDTGSVTASGSAIASFNNGTITVTDAQLLVGDAPITITYKAHLNNTVTPGEQLTNTATLNYSSEATGGYAETQVTAKAVIPVVLVPTELKTIIGLSNNFSASNVITGETVTYKLLTTLQDGTQHLRLTDNLPSGLTFVSATIASVGADISGIATGAITPTAGTFDFGTVVATPGTGTADQVEVDIVAIVSNLSGPDSITNTATALTSAPGSTTVGLQTSSSSAPTLTQVYSSLSGNVFTDNNDDGVKLGADAGLAGVTVNLLNGSGNPTGVTTKTDSNGNYSFTGLNVGSYSVQVVPPLNDGISPVGANANPALNSIVNSVGKTAAVTLLPGANTPNQNAGLYVPASISGNVFGDLNADGIAETGDTGLLGMTVSLIGADGHTVISTTTTDASGNYKFTGLKPGTYNVSVAQPNGQTFSPVGGSTTLQDSTVNSAGATVPVTLTSGQSAINQNAGLYGPGSLSGKVFTDNNDDGVISAADAGLGGLVVQLYTSGGVAGGPTTLTSIATTAADGTYSFANLHPGYYEVQVVAPAGDGFSPVGGNANPALDSIVTATGLTASVAVNSNANTPNQNAGVYVPVSLSGNVFNDSNDDGVRNGPDTARAGVVVQLLDGAGNPIAGTTATTDASGFYSFNGLKPGAYAVAVAPVTGDLFSPVGTNANPALDSIVSSLGKTAPVTLASGQGSINNNAGLFAPGSLSGTVFLDQNDDGQKLAGDTAIAGVTVQLLDGSGNPIAGKTTTTDANGNYSFGGLIPGNYAVAVTGPTGDGFSPLGANANPALDSVVNVAGRTMPVAVTNGANTPNQNAGVYAPVSLSGTVFDDSNDDGVKNGPDTAHAGVVVQLLDRAGNPIAGKTATTDTSGNYSFVGLKPGAYAVAVAAVAGDLFSPVGTNANPALDSIVSSLGKTAPVTLASGQGSINNNAGLFAPGSLSGTVFLDQNADGVKLAGDAAIAGVTVQLLDATGAAIAGKVTTTDASGNYSFGGLIPGNYAVAIAAPAGDIFSHVGANANPALDSIVNGQGRTSTIAVTNGHDTPNQNAGLYAPVSLTGNVFNDTNADGAHEAGENNIPSIQVQLLDVSGNAIAGKTATTDANGNYSFTGLLPGSYAVKVMLPANDTFSPNGASPSLPDSVVGANGVTPTVTLTSGQTANQVSGLYLPTPKLNLAKSADVALTDGGHVVTYTVVLSQAASSTGAAYNVILGDLLAPGETLVANSATATAGTVTSTGGKVAFTDPSFALSAAPITITYKAQVKGDVVNGQQIVNTANLAYASLPANGTAFTGASTATVGVQLLDGITKSVVGAPLAQSSNLASGDSVTFDLIATLDTGAQALTISDLLPTGLTYVSSKLDSLGGVTGSSLAVGASGSYNAATGTVSFNLGNVDTPIGAASNQVTIEVTATVAAGATIGSTLTNTGKLVSATPTNSYGVAAGTPDQTMTATAPILVVAPASINGNAFLDSHCDGSDNYGDPAFKGIVVKLYDGSGNFTGLTSTTDANGAYSFGNLAPGQYQVRYTLPNGTEFTYGAPGTDSNVDRTTGFSPIFTLAAGQNDTSHDVGLELTGGYANGPTTQLDATHTANNYTYTPTGTNIVVGGSGTQSDTIFGGGGNNILIGGMGSNVIEGGYGTDLILGGCGPFAQIQSLGTNDFVFGGTGDDLIQAHSGNAFVAAGPGDQTIVNTGGTDTFIANANRGTITYAGGAFSNIAVGDTFQTGANTTSIYEKGDGVLYINDYDPSRGDTLKIYGYGAPVAIGQSGIYEVLYFGPNAAILLRATSGVLANPSLGVTYSAALPTAPLLTVSVDANNFLTLTTAGSITPVIGQNAQPPVVVPPVVVPPTPTNVGLSQSSPTYTGGDTATNVTGPGGNTVTLGNGNNTVTLGGYGNSVTVGNGNNVIDMGLGNDTVVAGNGQNTIKAAGYGNVATVGSGTDTITIGLGATIHAAGGNQTIQLDGYSNMVFIGGAGASAITGGTGSSQITTTGGSAKITLGGYSNVVTTGAASDTIADGTGYTKFVIGTTQVGQANGTETISGFAANAGSVVDFVPLAANGQSAAQLFASLHTNVGGNAEIDFLNGGSVIFQGLAPSQLHLANFQVG